MKFFQHSPHPTQMEIHLLKGQLAAKTILSFVGYVSSGDIIMANTPPVLRHLNNLPGNVKNVRCAWLWNITIQWLSYLKGRECFPAVASKVSEYDITLSIHFWRQNCSCFPHSLSEVFSSTPDGLCCLRQVFIIHNFWNWEMQTQKAVQH